MHLPSLGNQRGQSLIQVMIAAGVMTLVMFAMMSMLDFQNSEMTGLAEKLAASDMQQQLSRALSDGAICTSMLVGRHFDSTNAVATSNDKPSISLSAPTMPVSTLPNAPALIEAGQPLSPLSRHLVANAKRPFAITEIVGSHAKGVGSFVANFEVNVDGSKLKRALRPLSTKISLQTVGANKTQRIISCASVNPTANPSGGIQGTCQVLWTSRPVTGVVGVRFCWGTAKDRGKSVDCDDGRPPLLIAMGHDELAIGETTSNGADLYNACWDSFDHSCHTSLYACF